MKIRDSHATLNGDETTHDLPSGGLQIVAGDGRSLYEVILLKTGVLQIRMGMVCRHGGKLLDDTLLIKPVASNVVEIIRPEYGAK